VIFSWIKKGEFLLSGHMHTVSNIVLCSMLTHRIFIPWCSLQVDKSLCAVLPCSVTARCLFPTHFFSPFSRKKPYSPLALFLPCLSRHWHCPKEKGTVVTSLAENGKRVWTLICLRQWIPLVKRVWIGSTVTCSIKSLNWHKENIFRGINSGEELNIRKVEEESTPGKHKLILMGRCMDMSTMQ